MDMKLGYCAQVRKTHFYMQLDLFPFPLSFLYCLTSFISNEINAIFQGDRTKNVGVVDSVYVVHKGIQTLGGSSHDATTKVLVLLSLLNI